MDQKELPNSEAYPIWTPVNLYQRGFDIICQYWHQTEPWSNKGAGTPEFEAYVFWRMNLVIWTSCTIESVVNLEGVSWMGEEYYKDVVEHLRIRQKIRLIYALKYNRQLARDDDTVKRVKELFELRNHYVHPKARSASDPGKNENNASFQKLGGYDPDSLKSLVQSLYNLIKDPLG